MNPQDQLLHLLANAQHFIEKPPKLDVAKNVKNPALRLATEMGQGIVNTPSTALNGANTVGQAVRGEKKTPQQLLGAAAQMAQLPLLIASFGAAAPAESGLVTAAKGVGNGALNGTLNGLAGATHASLPGQLTNAAIQGGLGAATGFASPLMQALHMRMNFNPNHEINGQFGTGAIEDSLTPSVSQSHIVGPSTMIRDETGNFVPAPANYKSPGVAKPSVGAPPSRMISVNGRLVPIFEP